MAAKVKKPRIRVPSHKFSRAIIADCHNHLSADNRLAATIDYIKTFNALNGFKPCVYEMFGGRFEC